MSSPLLVLRLPLVYLKLGSILGSLSPNLLLIVLLQQPNHIVFYSI